MQARLCAFGFALIVAAFLNVGCATLHSEGSATLRVECNVPEAAVLLDDAVFGHVADLAKKDKSLRPGFYRVEIRHPGYYSYFTEVTVADGGAAAVKAELHPLLD
jgi:hypothetical protein